LKKDWDPTKWSLAHILGVIRCLLIIPFPESSLNEEAGKLFMDDYEEYARMAKLMTKIHAKKFKKSSVKDIDENSNSIIVDSSNTRMNNEENKETEKHIKFQFQFQSNSNLDASMEEEKEPLQNF
jgi:ubiquitin-conjugating enzyme E2 S